jgi:hypothetical protein
VCETERGAEERDERKRRQDEIGCGEEKRVEEE